MNVSNTILFSGLMLLVGSGIGYTVGLKQRPEGLPMTHYMSDESMMSGSDMSSTMHSMTMSLEGKTGDDLDRAFLDEMIIHHEGAVEMAQTLVKGTQREELIILGNNIIKAQNQEIDIMKQWKKDWFTQE